MPNNVYVSINKAVIGSENGLLLARHQKIISTNTGLWKQIPVKF